MIHHARLPHATLIFAFALSAFAATPALAQQESIDLRPVWRDGQVARYSLQQTQTTQAEIQGVEGAPPAQQTVTEFSGEMTWRVVQADPNGGGRVEMTIDDLNMTITGPEGQQRSAGPRRADTDMESVRDWLGAMVGKPLTYTVSANGQIRSVSGYEAIQREAGEMADGMSERYFRNLGRDLAAIVNAPQQASIGTSWSATNTSDHQLGEVTSNTTYEVRGVEELEGVPTVTIARSSTLELEPELPDVPADGPEINFQQQQGEASGMMIFDLSRQEIVGYFTRQVIGARVTISMPNRQMTQLMTETTDTEILRISED